MCVELYFCEDLTGLRGQRQEYGDFALVSAYGVVNVKFRSGANNPPPNSKIITSP